MLTRRHVENDQTGTVRPVTVDQEEEHKIDFRVWGLSHAIVEEAEHLRVQELVKGSKIIFIVKHFMPTCSRITSTTHSEKFEGDDPRIGQCGVIRVVGKLYEKYNVLTVFFIEINEVCLALADNA